jgi:HlyD family secretion protein
MKRRLIIILIVAAGAAYYFFFRDSNGSTDGRILISGNIELTEVNIAFKTAGQLVERDADEGDRVTKGQTLARLDREQLLAQRAREEANLQGARAQLAQAQTALEWQRQTLDADLEQKSAEIGAAQARLTELRTGSRPEEKQEARAALDAAQAALERAERDWERAQKLYKDDDISTAQFDEYRSRQQNAEAALRQAKERLALVVAGPRSEVIEAASSQVQRAEAGRKMSEVNTLEVRRRDQELATRRADIARAQANIAIIDTQLAETVAVSPVDGVVLVKAADVGEILPSGTTVMTVGDIEHPWLRGYINETDLGRVKIGAPARVTTDSYPDKVYEGRVSFIAADAEFTPKQIQTEEERVKLVYRIKIDLENPNGELKSNMPANAEIILE